MSDKFLEDIIGEWVELAAHACRTVSTDLLWGDWQNYDWHQDLDVVAFLHGGTEIHYLRPGRHSRTRAIASNIRPSGELRNEQVIELPQGPPKTVDGATITVENWDSPAPLPFHYNADLESSAGKTKAKHLRLDSLNRLSSHSASHKGQPGSQHLNRASSSDSRHGRIRPRHPEPARVSVNYAAPASTRCVLRAAIWSITFLA